MSIVDFVPTPKLEDYKETLKDVFKIERTENGIVTVRMHTLDKEFQLSVEAHKAMGQMFKAIGADPENELMIFTGTGTEFLARVDPEGFALEGEDLPYWAYEYAYKDGRTNVSALVNEIEIPTIGVVNGHTGHAEMLLMCDITIMADDAVILDPHYMMGNVPGDGIHSCFQELLGVKRAAFALLTSQVMDAKTSLDYGLVNEILPKDQLMDRANEIAADIMKASRTVRRLTTQVLRRPWKKRIVDDLDGGFGIQMFGHLSNGSKMHSEDEFEDVRASTGIERQNT